MCTDTRPARVNILRGRVIGVPSCGHVSGRRNQVGAVAQPGGRVILTIWLDPLRTIIVSSLHESPTRVVGASTGIEARSFP